MIGVSCTDGKPLSGVDHLIQSIADILMTPLGTRVGLRDYGSALFELVDQPMNALGRLRLFAAVATALARWEPRIRIDRVHLVGGGADGQFTIALDATSTEQPSAGLISGLVIPLRIAA